MSAHLAADLLEGVRAARRYVASGRALLRPGSLAEPVLECGLSLLDAHIADLEALVERALEEAR